MPLAEPVTGSGLNTAPLLSVSRPMPLPGAPVTEKVHDSDGHV